MKNDYSDIIIEDIFHLLKENKNPWPRRFSKKQKLEFLDNLIENYEEKQEFEKCSILKGIKTEVINQRLKK